LDIVGDNDKVIRVDPISQCVRLHRVDQTAESELLNTIWPAVECRCRTALTGEIRGIVDLPPHCHLAFIPPFSLKVRVSSAVENAKSAQTWLDCY
jgi:hypothetical protein